MKMGSLFDGSGGFPLAARICGIDPVWASEVEPYPIAVSCKNFPNMKHLGNVCKVNGAEIDPVDVVTFGSPCQDLSIAGKREGLRHENLGSAETTRSGLFMEAVRIIKEMRAATYEKYPHFALWENVPGAFSSNKGQDFRTVLEELIRIVEPTAVMPAVSKKGWAYADYYRGNRWSLAYRVFDAQYWGVPQRRRRIYLVLDLRGHRAGKILFKRGGLRRCAAEGIKEGKAFAQNVGKCIKSAGVPYTLKIRSGCEGGGKGALIQIDKSATLATSDSQTLFQPIYCLQGNGIDSPLHLARRFTPTECARLQGFPDYWGDIEEKTAFTDEEYAFWLDVRNTHATINGKQVKEYTKNQMIDWHNKLHTDSAEYKMWGNGIALPTALYCMEGIEEELRG